MTEDGMRLDRVLRPGGGVIDLSGNIINVGICLGLEVFLPFRREFPEVMPESGEVAPVVGGFGGGRVWGKHFGSELGGPEGDFVEVSVVWGEVPAFSAVFFLTFLRPASERSEQGFPMGRVTWKIRMGMGVDGHGGKELGWWGGL
jgi:hypothetical protein